MRKLSPGALSRWLLLLGFALTILGAKFWLIRRAGSDLPVLDQWDGEAEFALRPWLENRLTAADILKPHNEHRIVTTKLQTLALTALNRQWDGYVETVFNAFIHLASAVLLLWCARRWLRGPPFFWFGLLLLLLFSLPFSWENTLVGFQAQFYYLLLFSLGHLIFSLESERFTVRWALGQLCAVLALATMATGFLSALAVLSALGYRLVRERRWTPQQIVTALLAGAAVVAGWAMKVDVAGHAILKAHTPFQFVFALLQLLAWPGPWFLPLVFAPAAIFIWRTLRRGAGNAPDPVLLGLLSWSLLQALALAYGRGGGAVEASRYTDLLAINVAVGGILILRQARPWFVGAWMVVAIGGLLTRSVHEAKGAIGSLPEIHQRQQELVRSYVANGDPAVFENQTWPEIPYPSAPVLRQRLDTPVLRAILPWTVRTPIRLREETMPRDPHSAPTLPRGNWEIALSTRGEPEAEREEVSWRSDPVATSTLPVLRFLVAGDLGNGSPHLRLTIKSREGETPVIPEAPSGERWKRVTVARPAGEWWIEATDGDPRGWFAFTRPIEMGWTSWVAEKMTKQYATILVAGLVLIGAATAIRRSRKLPRVVRPTSSAAAIASIAAMLAAGAIAVVLLVRLKLVNPIPPPVTPAPFTERDFALHVLSSRAPPPSAETFAGRVPPALGGDRWFGSYYGGDAFTGVLATVPFPLHEDKLFVPIAGYPHSPGTELALEIETPDGPKRIAFTGKNPTERSALWSVDVKKWRGAPARLVLTDASPAFAGWLAIGAPSFSPPHEVPWLENVRRNYLWFATGVVAVSALLLLPGLALATWRPGWRFSATVMIAIPGLLALAAAGLMMWLTGNANGEVFAVTWLLAHGVLALLLAVRWWGHGVPLAREDCQAGLVYGAVVVAALAYGVLPLEVAQEFGARTTVQSRMIASPPDHDIPWRTAAYFLHGKDGNEDRAAYFGEMWSVGSRGPLLPLALTSLFAFFDVDPGSPPGARTDAWPASSDGFWLARAFTILCNALVVLAGAALASHLAPHSQRLALLALACAPVVAINTDFVWPKLLATTFVVLAVRAIVAQQPAWRSALWCALAYLSHPVGALMTPPVFGFLAWRAWRESEPDRRLRTAVRAAGWFAGALAACLLPWLAYKAWLGHPDAMLRYTLGDGRGFLAVASIGSWLDCRWQNFWLTVVPAGFFYSSHMTAWLEGPLSPTLRWAVGYAKSLPGAMGLILYPAALYSLFRPAPQSAAGLRFWIFAGAFATMLVFWGFSNDGLGRNCLEPLSILLIIYAAAALPPVRRGWYWVLPIAALEMAGIRVLGIVAAPDFASWQINGEAAALLALSIAAALAPAMWYVARPWYRSSDSQGLKFLTAALIVVVVGSVLARGSVTSGQILIQNLTAWLASGLVLAGMGMVALAAVQRLGGITQPWQPLVAGALVCAAGYATFWAYFLHPWFGHLVAIGGAIGAMTFGWGHHLRGLQMNPEARRIALLGGFIGLGYIGVLHLYSGSGSLYALSANRFLAGLPGDNELPHLFAERLYTGSSLKPFSGDWLSSDRPPLQTGWILLTRAPLAPLGLDAKSVSGMSAIWFQLLWVPACYGLLRWLQIPPRRSAVWVALLSLSGFFLLHSTFVWPKLAAGALMCGTFVLWVSRAESSRLSSALVAGSLCAAMAWLAHGGVAFSLLALVPWIAWDALKGRYRDWLLAGCVFALAATPWLLYQKFYDPPGNRLVKWHLGGQIAPDPRGVWETLRENYGALDGAAIGHQKLENFKTLFRGEWHELVATSAAGAEARRIDEFFHTFRAFGWWLVALFFLPLIFRRLRVAPPESASRAKRHGALLAWSLGTLCVWCALMFKGGEAIVHQGSFAAMIALYALFAAWCDVVGRFAIPAMAVLQLAAFVFTWVPGNEVIGGNMQPLAWGIIILGAAGVILIGCRPHREVAVAENEGAS